MKLVNGSYRQCINKECRSLPTIVFDIEGQGHRGGTYSIKILSCAQHEMDAEKVRQENYRALLFRKMTNPSWLGKAQEQELHGVNKESR